jgi:glycosyltransferase involved in cell wall biosynthesis
MPSSECPLISLIVPVYNISKHLERCITSIINQSYKHIEIILVDDGSTDTSGQICDRYREKDSRITVVHQTNKGLSGARNAGLSIMRGDYVGFVDGDDFIDTFMYETLLKAIIAHEADVVQTGFHHADEHGNIIDTVTFKEASYLNANEMFHARFKENNIHVGVWTKLYKNEIFKKIRFFEGYVFEDYAILPNILNECKKFVVIEGAFYNYASNPTGISSAAANLTVIKSRLKTPLYVLQCLEKINKNFIEYGYLYICESSIKGYCKIKETTKIDTETKKEYIEKLRAQYEKYFELYKNDSSIKKQKVSRRIKWHLFSSTPYLVYLIITFKNLSRRSIKKITIPCRRFLQKHF